MKFPVRTVFSQWRVSLSLVASIAIFSVITACSTYRAPKNFDAKKDAAPLKLPRAESAAPVVPPFECRWAEGAIKIDGKADEPAWQNAQVITNFTIPWLGKEGAKPPTATTARLLWDRDYVYFHAQMEDRDVYAGDTNQDGSIWLSDVFELFFKPAKDRLGYYEFEINAANAKLDMFLPSRGAGGYPRFKSDGEFHIDSKVLIDGTLNNYTDVDRGWSVEGRIPWKDFARTGGRPEPGEEWTFALCRYDYSVGLEEPALSTCAPLRKKDFHNYEGYAPLRFIGPRAPHALWQKSRVIGSPEPPPPFRPVAAFPNFKTEHPVNIFNEPGSDRLILIELAKSFASTSRLRRFANRADAADAEVILTLEETAYGIAFHPGFATNGWMFVGCNGPSAKTPRFTRVLRYTMQREAPFKIDPQSRQLIIEWASDGHNGGDLCFGNDGMLYVTSGDGTSDSDENVAGQDLSKLTAKVLRIDIDRPAAGQMYSVPRDNPFLELAGARPETWAYGLRNPWKISADRESGQIWVGENGQDVWEMARLLQRGANYGWSVYEGSHPFYLERKLGPHPLTPPTLEHHHAESRSLTGGLVYRGSKLPGLRGAYVYGDYSTGKIWGARHDGTRVTWQQEIASTRIAITGFGADEQRELFVLDYNGGIYRLEPTPPAPATAAPFPTKLSETGLFTSTRELTPDPALIAYSVNSPLWSDGAHKERFIALPGDTKIGFTHNRAFDFPEGAVLVKTFALDLEAGNAASRRRLETRLLTKQQNEWVGYTYVWNDEQTDATLQGAGPVDREFTVRDARAPGGTRKIAWHFPSRAECMVCHARAAKYVLGLTEAQLNRAHDYGGGKIENQLEHLERLGVLKTNPMDYERDAIRREMTAQGLKGDKIEPALKALNSLAGQRVAAKESSLLPRPADRMRRLADPADPKADLEARARSYLQANCAHCHVRAGGGNAQIELDFLASLADTKMIDERPLHHTFGIADPRIVAPGAPERSTLLRRVSNRDAGHMPPIATSLVDDVAVQVLRDWIAGLKK